MLNGTKVFLKSPPTQKKDISVGDRSRSNSSSKEIFYILLFHPLHRHQVDPIQMRGKTFFCVILSPENIKYSITTFQKKSQVSNRELPRASNILKVSKLTELIKQTYQSKEYILPRLALYKRIHHFQAPKTTPQSWESHFDL